MNNWQSLLISPEEPITKALKIIDARFSGDFRLLHPNRIALVVDGSNKLLGIVTDGDIRQSHLNGFSQNAAVSEIMNKSFQFCGDSHSKEAIFKLMREKHVSQLPVLSSDGRVVGVELLEEYVAPSNPDNLVVLVAGGQGTRLGELTKDCPKPLIEICGRPVIETILLNFVNFGFKNFKIIINFLGEQIVNRIGDGKNWGVNIEYLREEKKMGTAGGLSLISKKPKSPLIVMNADVLTKLSLVHLLDFHAANESFASMCVREFTFQVPFGVAQVDGPLLTGIDEKPVQRFFVNAGIYVLSPDVLDIIPKDRKLDMPDLFSMLFKLQKKTIAFPVREYWMDIGRVEDLEKAKDEFLGVFQ